MWRSPTVRTHHGKNKKYLIHRWSSGQRQKSTYTQTQSYVLENCLHSQMQPKGGKGSSWIFRQQFLIKNSTESTENLLSESGIFSQDLLYWQCFGRFRMIYWTATLSLRILEIELSWCPCSTTLIGTRKTMKESVFQNPKKSEIMRRDFRKDIGRSWTKTCGEIVWKLFLQAREEDGIPQQHTCYNDFEETDNPIFTSVSAMNRGVLERVKSQETVHFTEETPNTELLFRIIHSANQFSMYGAVWSWSGQPSPNETEPILEKFVTSEESVNTVTLKSVSSQEISSLVDSARSRHVSGNRGRDDLQDIYFLEEPYWIARICEVASFWNLVQTGKHYKTHPDMKDGSWRLHTSMPRVLTTSNWRTLNSAWCDSRRNCVPCSTTLYSGKKLGNVWNWNLTSFHRVIQHEIPTLCNAVEWIAAWMKHVFQNRNTTTPAESWSQKKKLKRWNFVPRIGDNLALRKLVPREAIVMKNQRATRQAQLPSEGEIGKLFLSLEDPTHLLKQRSRSSWWYCCDIAIRKSETLMVLRNEDAIHSRLLKELGSRMGRNCSQRD